MLYKNKYDLFEYKYVHYKEHVIDSACKYSTWSFVGPVIVRVTVALHHVHG